MSHSTHNRSFRMCMGSAEGSQMLSGILKRMDAVELLQRTDEQPTYQDVLLV